jgi:hypothetical protein
MDTGYSEMVVPLYDELRGKIGERNDQLPVLRARRDQLLVEQRTAVDECNRLQQLINQREG